MPATTDWLDPFVALSAAATVTSRIRLGTGICIAVLRSLLQQRQRDPAAFEIVVAPFTKPIRPADLARYQAAGVDEVAIVASPPRDESRVTAWVEDLANEWVRAAGILA